MESSFFLRNLLRCKINWFYGTRLKNRSTKHRNTENGRLIFLSYIRDDITLYEHIRAPALCKGNSIAEQFMRTCTTRPLLHHENIKKRSFFIGALYEQQRAQFYHLRSLEWKVFDLQDPRSSSEGILRMKMENENRYIRKSISDLIYPHASFFLSLEFPLLRLRENISILLKK